VSSAGGRRRNGSWAATYMIARVKPRQRPCRDCRRPLAIGLSGRMPKRPGFATSHIFHCLPHSPCNGKHRRAPKTGRGSSRALLVCTGMIWVKAGLLEARSSPLCNQYRMDGEKRCRGCQRCHPGGCRMGRRCDTSQPIRKSEYPLDKPMKWNQTLFTPSMRQHENYTRRLIPSPSMPAAASCVEL
jgi:hypothetical protein